MADAFQPDGNSALAQMLHAIQYGDYVSYYTAIATDTDPTSIPQISELEIAAGRARLTARPARLLCHSGPLRAAGGGCSRSCTLCSHQC